MEWKLKAEVAGMLGTDHRSLSAEQAATLDPGTNHYRTFVGPPDRFDFMSATQFALLFQCGLREHHTVLDFGAGSLRAGRLLIPYLRPRCYYAIEPNTWLLEDGIFRELGQDAVNLKQPSFSSDDGFDCTVFGRKFDFIMAQSIVTHCGPSLFRKLMGSIALALENDGLAMFSYSNSPTPSEHPFPEEWVYPQCLTYSEDQVQRFLLDAGLVGIPIPWFHPGAKWFLAAMSPQRLPTGPEASLLNGVVLHDPQFATYRL